MRHVLGVMTILFIATTVRAESRVEPAKGYEPIAHALTPFIRQELIDKKIPAISIALVVDQQIVWAEGFGLEHPLVKKAATADTVYRVGSVSKLYTDTLVMQLVEQGLIDLDAPVNKYIRTFQPTNPFNRDITVRHLMTHRSGLVRESPIGHYFDPNQVPLDEMVKSLNRTETVYAPGERIKYSNAAIATVGHIIERVTRVPFHPYARKHILDPLDMKSSSFALDQRVTRNFADSIMWTYTGRTFPSPIWDLSMPPAGSLYSTVLDQSNFIKMVLAGGTFNGKQILKPETLKQMMTIQFAKEGDTNGFGIGFSVGEFEGHQRISHGGAVYGFATELSILPDQKIGVIVCASKDVANSVTTRIANESLRMLLAHKNNKPLPVIEKTTPIKPELARKLAGRYENEEKFIDLYERAGKLFLIPGAGGMRQELRANADGLITDDVLAYGTKFKIDGDKLISGKDEYHKVEVKQPTDIPAHWKGLIGEYGWDHNILYILEKDGKLYCLIEWVFLYPLKEINQNVYTFPDFGLYHGEKLIFSRNADGNATEVEAVSVVFTRRKVQGEDGSTYKIKPIRAIDILRKEAMKATPPREEGEFRAPDLVDLSPLDPTILLDIRYATENNFLGTTLYTTAKAYLQRPAADALLRTHKKLAAKGYGLLIHDAYRPWFVTKIFYDATPDYLRNFVADPSKGSRHNRGCAVDLTLYDLKTGKPVQMVSGFDEFSDRAFPDYIGGTSKQRWLRDLLRSAMQEEGFTVYEDEWWHFDYKDWRSYPIMNLPFEEIGKK